MKVQFAQHGTFAQVESVFQVVGAYLGWQTRLNRRIAIKEFFMKEYCNRNADTSHITIGTEGSRELVPKDVMWSEIKVAKYVSHVPRKAAIV